jgi:hypothetical protein
MLFSRNPGTFNPGDKLYKEGAKKKPAIFNNYQDDDSTMHFSKESQYDAGPAMPKQVAAGSAKPQYEDDPMTEPEMTKPSLFGGMDRPERAKPKWYDYALSFLLPALQGGLSGQGALSGLVSGVSNMLSNKFKNQAKDEANWEKDREFGQKQQNLTLLNRKAQTEEDYKNKMLGISSRNADANMIRAKRPASTNIAKTEIEKVAAAQARADQAVMAGMEPDPQDLALIELYNNK